jgi:hypothetical protein
MADLYTPSGQGKFDNLNLNAIGSMYADSPYNHDTTDLVQRIMRYAIYDAAPQQYFDLAILNMKTPEQVNSDEYEYLEMGYGRDPITVVAPGIASPGADTQQVVPVADTTMVSKDTIVVYPDGTKGTVIALDADHVTVYPLNGGTLPLLNADDLLALLSPLERDASEGFSQYFRMDYTKKYGFVQLLVKAMRFGRVEMFKYQRAGTTDYLTMNKQRFMQQFRIDLSNIYWNGTQGEATLSDGTLAKTAGGVYPAMVTGGSPSTTTPVATIGEAVEEMALQTEFKSYGATKFLYGTPRYILALSKYYKQDLVRYTPNDQWAKLGLSGVDIGSSRIVFVPIKRFEDTASFPVSWQKRLFLLDQESIVPKQMWGEEYGETLDRQQGVPKTFKDYWVSANFSIAFFNPQGSAFVDII